MKTNVKTVLSTLIVSALLTGTAYAEGQHKGKRGANIDQVISSLQLDATTASSLKTLMESQRAEKQALRKSGTKDREQRKTLRTQHRQAVLELIGEEKMEELKKLKGKKRSKHGKRGKRGEHKNYDKNSEQEV